MEQATRDEFAALVHEVEQLALLVELLLDAMPVELPAKLIRSA